jgi:hypothetical protein
MKQLLFPLVAALPLAYPATAAAQLVWIDSAWSVTPTLGGVSPPHGSGSVSFSNPAADSFTGSVSAYAANPPGGGGTSVYAGLQVSRSFRVNTPELVTLRVPIAGTLSAGPVRGGTDALFNVRFAIEPVPIFISRNYHAMSAGPPVQISETATASGTFPAGTYTIRGDFALQASSSSGGPSARGDVTVGVSLLPTPLPIPEPSGLSLAGCGVAGSLGAMWLRGWRRGRRTC